ncbi:hypothetical protein [Phaeobacter gallaeciensis]|uniref:hypothetical protein n=1 Tax=Phaeobacter gallaeciensis TaxID=60890 RepID=UPI0012DE6B9F|nr:hypothetical protein [Phaeobacter gallaeciensis]
MSLWVSWVWGGLRVCFGGFGVGFGSGVLTLLWFNHLILFDFAFFSAETLIFYDFGVAAIGNWA